MGADTAGEGAAGLSWDGIAADVRHEPTFASFRISDIPARVRLPARRCI